MITLKTKDFTTILACLALGLMVLTSAQPFLKPVLARSNQQVLTQKNLISKLEHLAAHRLEYESEWQIKSSFFEKSGSEDAMTVWTRRLIQIGEAENLALTKIEPSKKEGETRVNLSFRGNALTLVRFIHDLYEKDPLAIVDSIRMFRDAETNESTFELQLSKRGL